MPLNTCIDVKNPSAFTIRNHAFGARPSTTADLRGKAVSQSATPSASQAAHPAALHISSKTA